MTEKVYRLALCVALAMAATTAAMAQGVQSGTIRGAVATPDGLPLRGASVMVVSPALQGERTVTTEERGNYVLRALPPGVYTVSVAFDGLATQTKQVEVPLGGVVDVTVTLQRASVAETVQVVGRTSTLLTTPVVGANYRKEEIDSLATPRTLSGIASLAPGLTTNGPASGPTEGQGQVVINGGFGFDNIFMVNGVDVNDNIFAWPQNLFVEDAIAETQVLTSGISAEYGRFTGGVVNAITKSGGNVIAGSYRANLANGAWSTETPFENANGVTRKSTVNATHEATLGGPIVRDRLWFFAAGRHANAENANTLPFTGQQYTTTDRNQRGELKLTSTLVPGHTLQGSFLADPRQQTNQANFSGGTSTVDPNALSDKKRPNHLFATNYKGLVNRFLLEAQYSQQQFETDLGGGTSRSIVDSPFLSFDATQQYNAPYFDRHDPDGRNNRQLTGSASYFTGPHELKAGYEFFRSEKVGGNAQTATGYVFLSDYATDASGAPVYDGNGRLMPVFLPGETQIFTYMATPGAVLNVDTQSLYAQDHWRLGAKLSADLGLRVEHVTSNATLASPGVNAQRAVPRLGLALDPKGDGDVVFRATYAHYSGRHSDALMSANSPVGHPNEVDGVYVGPSGSGRNFAAGFDPANYDYDGIYASFPSANVFFDKDLSSPLTKEFTASAGKQIGGKGSTQATYVWRRTTNLIEDYTDLTTGVTHIDQDAVDMLVSTRVYANSDDAWREYQGLLFQGRYDMRRDWTVNGHYTVQLKNDGNYEGESGQSIGGSMMGDYPEILSEARHFPSGHLAGFQRHKVDVWTIYNRDFGRYGDGTFSGMWRYNSGRVYSLRAANQGITAVQANILAAAGYVDAPSVQTIYYSGLGAERFAGYAMLDLAASYNVPVFRSLRPWLKVDLFNALDNQKLVSWNTSIKQDSTTARDALGLRTGYVKGALFGQGTGNLNYPVPFQGQTGGRTLRLAMGFRF
jgi:carboxypeptidase family protein